MFEIEIEYIFQFILYHLLVGFFSDQAKGKKMIMDVIAIDLNTAISIGPKLSSYGWLLGGYGWLWVGRDNLQWTAKIEKGEDGQCHQDRKRGEGGGGSFLKIFWSIELNGLFIDLDYLWI